MLILLTQKHFTQDAYNEPSLNYAHLWVYHAPMRGMCLDMEWHPLASERLSEEELARQYIEEVAVEDIEGKPFDGFEEAFFEEGGRVGGW
jgi:alpha 1,2-mannosyltransferase